MPGWVLNNRNYREVPDVVVGGNTLGDQFIGLFEGLLAAIKVETHP